jgi:hypothetical protein
VELMQIG